ncbi:hypothetical protein N7541_011835 [Penicillium brevicompactum]|uniref:NADP-dependent oxidoreductase domain-containing protein n=1 Tax=Penicillium brevicompactum TaxID=5074 RepID=A0A9W9UL97_PENBR|nr:hypothetical protein N7541_011835 [Penicillium brevicompactum]
MSLSLRKLGQNGPQISAVGLGFGSIGGFYGPAGTLDEKVALLDHAYASGLRFWDLSDVYGDSESVVGKWIKRSGKRDDVFIGTKFSLQRQPDGSHTFHSDPAYAKEACTRSLRTLGVETIDLYYCHAVDGITPIEKTVEAMVELKNEGKIRHIGLSGVSAATLRRAHAIHPIAALQWEYSLFTLDIEPPNSEILETCRELGVTLVAFCPIARGIFTRELKSYKDIPGHLRMYYPKYAEMNFPAILKLVDGVKDIADVHGVTPAQVALAWLLAQGPNIIPIPGTKSASKMDENASAALLALSYDEVRKIRTLAENAEIEGPRYRPSVMAALNQDTPDL